MISIPYKRDNDGRILIERDLTETENQNLVRQVINTNTVDYYFVEDDIESEITISELKRNIISKVDELTHFKISSGFEYNGKMFSMSTNAQINWSVLLSIPDEMFPIKTMDINENVYLINKQEKHDFYNCYISHKQSKLEEGISLKLKINDILNKDDLLELEKNIF